MNTRISFYTKPFERIKNYFDMIDLSVEYGFTSLEGFCFMDFEEPDEEKAKAVRAYADSKNISFSCFSVFINLVGEDADVMMDRLKGYARVAKILGSPYLHHTIANNFDNFEFADKNREVFFEKGIKAVREIYDYAESIGIKTIYEEQGYIFNGVSSFGTFLDNVDREVGIVADVANIYQVGDNIIDFVKTYGNKVVHIHIKDITITSDNTSGFGLPTFDGRYMNAVPVGEGIVPIKEVMDLLEKSGYKGYYTLEEAAEGDDSTVINRSLEYINNQLQ